MFRDLTGQRRRFIWPGWSRGGVCLVLVLMLVLISCGIGLSGFAAADRLEAVPLSGLPLEDNWLLDAGHDSLLSSILISPKQKALREQEALIPDREAVLNLGETFVFSVRYGLLRAGEAIITLDSIKEVDGDSCYHVVAVANSNDFVSTFYHVRDRMESFLDKETLLPQRNEKHLLEGDYINDIAIDFDHKLNVAFYSDGQTFNFIPGSHDVLSSFYHLRMRNLEPGMSFDLENHVDRKNYPIRFNVERRERIKVPAGEFDCLVIQPVLRTPQLFQHKGKIWIWLTDDDRKIPVQMKSELVVGSFSIVLTEIRG